MRGADDGLYCLCRQLRTPSCASNGLLLYAARVCSCSSHSSPPPSLPPPLLPPGVSNKQGTQVALTIALEGSVADYDDTWRGEMEAWVRGSTECISPICEVQILVVAASVQVTNYPTAS